MKEPVAFLATYFTTKNAAKKHILKHVHYDFQFVVLECGEGYLVVSGEVYSKYFKK